MKAYLGKHKFYVINEDKLVYEVNNLEMYANWGYIRIGLELVAGWDYIDPDNNDIQGYVPADRFVEDVQYEVVVQYFLEESMHQVLKEDGYTILTAKNMTPALAAIINKRTEL